jgi:hypothetical protein
MIAVDILGNILHCCMPNIFEDIRRGEVWRF